MEENKKNQIIFIAENIKKILDLMGISSVVEFQENSGEGWFTIKTQEAPLLIGDNGKHLSALTFLIKRFYEKKFPNDQPWFVLDINDYNKKHIEEIKDTARMHAQRVRYFKKDVEMRPMNAYERRIVHSVLQEYPDITTESIGDGIERRVVVKLSNLV